MSATQTKRLSAVEQARLEERRAEAETEYVVLVARKASGQPWRDAEEDKLDRALRTLDRPLDEFSDDMRATRQLLAKRAEALTRPEMPAAERTAAMAAARRAVLDAEKALQEAKVAEMELVRTGEREGSMRMLIDEAELRVRHLQPGLAAALKEFAAAAK